MLHKTDAEIEKSWRVGHGEEVCAFEQVVNQAERAAIEAHQNIPDVEQEDLLT